MTAAQLKLISLPKPSGFMDTVRALFATPDHHTLANASLHRNGPHIEPLAQDRSRYARLLAHELHRHPLTAMERDESATMLRMRSALYSTD